EADARGYRFARSKLRGSRSAPRMIETTGQIRYELAHLRRKLRKRDPRRHRALSGIKQPAEHPMFRIVRGVVRDWEKKKLKPRMNAGKRRQSSGRESSFLLHPLARRLSASSVRRKIVQSCNGSAPMLR